MASGLHSILLLADRSHEAQAALQKASVLARHFAARIELFACDTEHGWAIEHRGRQAEADATLERCMIESRRYLEALRSSISARDLQLTSSATCAPSLLAGVTQRLADLQPDLVIKSIADGAPDDRRRTPSLDDWELVHRCAVPLLLTGRRPWRPVPQVWMAVDVESDDTALEARVHAMATGLAEGCGGQLHRHRSSDLAGSLAPLLQAQRIDLLVLAGPDPARGAAEWLLTPLDCDVVIVPRRAPGSALAMDTSDGHHREG